jgi:hypothetical protein
MNRIAQIESQADKTKALAIIEQLKTAVESGNIAGFACITISKTDELHTYIGNVTGIRNLRFTGAASHLLNEFLNGE